MRHPGVLSGFLLLPAIFAAAVTFQGDAAALIVTSLADSGAGTLRQALLDNATLGGGNAIVFSNTLTGTISLTSAELTISAPAIIQGPGPSLISISGNRSKRVFTISGGPTQISGLTIRDGVVIGQAGAPGTDGSDAHGGAIFNQSTLTLSNCIVLSNSVVGGAGGTRSLGTVGNGGAATGSGIYSSNGNVFIFSCTFLSNSCAGGAGAGGAGDGGDGGNALGGALYLLGGTNQITASSFISNSSLGGAGGISTNGGTAGARGQAYGGGVYNESSLAIFSSTISGGSAIGSTTGSSTGKGLGGGIYNGMDLALYSSTIASNSVGGSSFDAGGGIYNTGSAALGITNCTIAANQSDVGGGINGNATVGGTIIALNSATTAPDVNGTVNSSDYNLIQNSSGLTLAGSTAHVILGQNPLLGPLQNNGGPTFTMALLIGSPAIDQSKSFGFTTDQRGFPRPNDVSSITNVAGSDGSDIGAYEFLSLPQLNIQISGNTNIVLFWNTNGAATAQLQSITNISSTNWIYVTNNRTLIGSQAFVTNSTVGKGKFYRLIIP